MSRSINRAQDYLRAAKKAVDTGSFEAALKELIMAMEHIIRVNDSQQAILKGLQEDK